MHLWHGRTPDRQYEDRPKILVRNRYDPHFDVRPRHDGLLELAPDAADGANDRGKPLLRRDLLDYFASRNEDSIDTAETDRRRRRHDPPPPPHYPRPR
jgi:hypothetical protein